MRMRTLNPESVPSISSSLLPKICLVKEALKPVAEVIYYPCCATDVTLSTAFPDSRVIYLDRDEDCVTLLQHHGFESVVGDARTFVPDQAPDIVMIMNPTIAMTHAASLVKIGGYVLCNNYHGTASQLRTESMFQHVGSVRGRNDTMVFDTEELENYWKQVETEEEFRSNALFEFLQMFLAKYGDESSGALEGYKQLLERSKTMKPSVFIPSLPSKKYTTFYVFRRIS